MKRIKIFLASSNELKSDREAFEREIYRKAKIWVDRGIFLHLDVWEDLSARLSRTRSQDAYNEKIADADLFVLLAHSKVGMYTAEEFETAFGRFHATEKPFIFTYFKQADADTQASLQAFKERLRSLGHFYGTYDGFDDLWNQFNKELDRLDQDDFTRYQPAGATNTPVSIKNQINHSTLNHPVFE